MKTKSVFAAGIAIAFMAAAGFMMEKKHEAGREFTPVEMATIEALSDPESMQRCKWYPATDSYGCPLYVCVAHGNGSECSCGDMRRG